MSSRNRGEDKNASEKYGIGIWHENDLAWLNKTFLKETNLVEANQIVPAKTSDEGVVVQVATAKKKRGRTSMIPLGSEQKSSQGQEEDK